MSALTVHSCISALRNDMRRNRKNESSILMCLSGKPVKALSWITGVTLARNLLFPLYADDYVYSFIWDGEHRGNLLIPPDRTLTRVKTARDVAVSQLSHYKTWGGRSVAHVLDQSFLTGGKTSFNFANTAVTLAQLLLADRLGAGEDRKLTNRLLLWLGGCYWFCMPHLVACCQWMTGSFNYLWMGVLQAAFALPYSRRIFDAQKRLPPLLMAPLGLLTGWSNEAGAGAALLYGGLATVRSWLRREKDTAWMLTGLLSGCAGLAAMLFAPGNLRRIELTREYEPPVEADDPDRTSEELYYTPAMFRHHFRNGFRKTVLRQLPMHIPVLLCFTRFGRRSREMTENLLMLEAASLAVPCAMMLSPEFPERAAYPGVIYGLAASGAAARCLGRESFSGIFAYLERGFEALLAVSVGAALAVDYSLFRQTRQRMRDLQEQRGQNTVVLKKYSLPKLPAILAGNRAMDVYGLSVDLDGDTHNSYNRTMAQYYGARNIRGVEAENRRERT